MERRAKQTSEGTQDPKNTVVTSLDYLFALYIPDLPKKPATWTMPPPKKKENSAPSSRRTRRESI